MTFTYDLVGGGKIAQVRFHLADTEASAPVFTDEEVTALLAMYQQDVGATVVACIQHILGLLSQPNFTADWLTVDNRSAREGYQALLVEKRQVFGLAGVKGRIVAAPRSDTPEA